MGRPGFKPGRGRQAVPGGFDSHVLPPILWSSHDRFDRVRHRDQRARPFRLTALAHGGGCGCKIGPALLREMLSDACLGFQHPDLLVGAATSDDAAVYRINEQQAVIATTDFFMPIVDDPFEFGRISATNALSDVYAMGGSPILALAIVGMPVGKMPTEVMRRIMEGGADVCRCGRIPLAGGHSIDSPEPIYGLAVVGLVEPGPHQTQRRRAAWRRAGARQAARHRRAERGAEERHPRRSAATRR